VAVVDQATCRLTKIVLTLQVTIGQCIHLLTVRAATWRRLRLADFFADQTHSQDYHTDIEAQQGVFQTRVTKDYLIEQKRPCRPLSQAK
jgi:hypothetical protein